MMKTIFLFLFTSLIIFSSCSSTKKSTAQTETPDNTKSGTVQIVNLQHTALATPIIIDGDLSDWNTNLAYTDNGSGISTMVDADTSDLFIAMHVTNQPLQMKILKMGMQISFDITGNKKESEYIVYPTQLQVDDATVTTTDNSEEGDGSAPTHDFKGMKQKLLDNAIILETKGLKFTHDGMHAVHNAEEPHAALKLDVNNNLVYEAAVPLKDIFGTNNITNADLVNIGFKIKGFSATQSDHSEGDNSGGGMSGRGGGGMHGGGMHGGGGGMHGGGGSYHSGSGTGYGGGDAQSMTKDTQFWIDAKFN